MNTPRYITDAPAALRATLQRKANDREYAELLRWLLDQGLDFIGLRDGGGIDCANHPGGARAALFDARRDQQHGEHP